MPDAPPNHTLVVPGAEPFTHAGDDGPAGRVGVLLLHGFTSNPGSVRDWGEHLAAAGFTVLGPRLPGHGTSWQDCNTTDETDWVRAADRALDQLVDECDRVVVAGLSMGGTLAIRLAELRPADVAGLVLVNPSLHTERFDARLLPLLARLTPSWKPIGSDIKKPGVTELAYDKLPTRAMRAVQRLWGLTRPDLARVTAPLVVFRSVEDHVVEASNTQLLLAGVSSTDVLEVPLKDSYHVATLDYDASRIFTESAEWIQARFVRPPATDEP